MFTTVQQFRDVQDLREFVNETFCQHYQLQLGAFSMTERILRRGKKPCGIYFCLHGPRAVRFTAIWETEHNQVLFYGCSGERLMKMQLLDGPSLDRAAA
jgi:hypothetical protein